MTQEQKNRIMEMRNKNCGYSAIASELNISRASVKGFCQRNNLDGMRGENGVHSPCSSSSTISIQHDENHCKHCGEPLQQKEHCKRIIFCSKDCRQLWWNNNLHLVNRKAVYHFTCVHCGKEFTAYGNKNRKYCSHECYIFDRFGK